MINLLKLFFTFFKIGLFTFGGGYAMIPLIIQESSNFNINEEEILNFVGISESTPGPFAINIATFIGYEQYGIIGAIVGTLGVILPSFIIILLIINIIEKIKDNRFFKSVIETIMPIVIGLIMATTANILLTNLFNIENIFNIKNEFSINMTELIVLPLIIFIIAIVYLITNKKLAPIFTIIICASLGIIISYLFAFVA